jgi:hypothetical protein
MRGKVAKMLRKVASAGVDDKLPEVSYRLIKHEVRVKVVNGHTIHVQPTQLVLADSIRGRYINLKNQIKSL